jgi:Na+-transporting NADH:ubiquinone oxidoreductase subunit D
MMSLGKSASWVAVTRNLWDDNPVFRQVLGICSTLAVTNLVLNTLLMCAGLVFATACTSLTVSYLRDHTPKQVRMMVQVLIAAAYVIVVDIAIRAFFPEVHKVIGPYVGLIITNCIIMGRAEAYACKNPPWPSFLDGIGAGLGYSMVLLGIAAVRETLGFGTLLGFALPGADLWWHQWTIFVMPPGAFFMLALVAWLTSSAGRKGSAAGGSA